MKHADANIHTNEHAKSECEPSQERTKKMSH